MPTWVIRMLLCFPLKPGCALPPLKRLQSCPGEWLGPEVGGPLSAVRVGGDSGAQYEAIRSDHKLDAKLDTPPNAPFLGSTLVLN